MEDWINYKIQLRDRLKEFALKILELSKAMPKSSRGKVLDYQLVSSGTSMYANYRAALRGRSKKEFIAKLSITVEEADETEMWLDLIIASGILTTDFVVKLHAESLELLKMLSSMRKRATG